MTDNIEEFVSDLLDEILLEATDIRKKKSDNVKLNISSVFWDGTWLFDITKLSFISRIKRLVLYELNGTETDMTANQYMLIFPSEKRSLHDNKTIKEERLKDNDELELIKLPPSEEYFMHFTHRLTDTVIKNATKDLAKRIERPFINNVGLDIQAPEFMSDLRKIMITLIEYSLTLMSSKPNAKDIYDRIRRKLMAENFFIDEKMINKYKNSGATMRRIKFGVNASYKSIQYWELTPRFRTAMRVKNCSVKCLFSDNSVSVNQWLAETKSIASANLGIPDTLHVNETLTVEKELEDLLILFRQYLRASFKICPKAEETMKEMGFGENDIIKALRFTGNNVSESVEYIVGSRNPDGGGARPGLANGISPTSDMYRVLMAEPDIITPLQRPIVLYACISVIDANSFFVPSVKCPGFMHLLNKILTTYYINKCDFIMHQMLGHEVHD